MSRSEITVDGLEHRGQPIPVAVRANGLVFSSPIGPRRRGGTEIPPDLPQQLAVTFENFDLILRAGNIQRDDVMFVRVQLANWEDRQALNEVWAKFFDSPRPARQVSLAELPQGARILLRFTAVCEPERD